MSSRGSYSQNFNGLPVGKIVGFGLLGLLVLCALFGSTYVVDQGRFGVVQRFGQIQDVTEPGLHMKLPFVDSVTEIPSALQTVGVTTVAVSKDIQDVTTKLNVQYQIPAAIVKETYKNYRSDREALDRAVVVPGVEAVLKTVTAKFTAEELISSREKVSSDLQKELSAHLKRNGGLILVKVDITAFTFSESFTKAIEDKVVSEQAVLTERQILNRQEVKAQQRVVDAEANAKAIRATADAEAYAIRKQNENATELTVRLRDAEARLKAAEAEALKAQNWRPTVIGGATPLMQVPSSQQSPSR